MKREGKENEAIKHPMQMQNERGKRVCVVFVKLQVFCIVKLKFNHSLLNCNTKRHFGNLVKP